MYKLVEILNDNNSILSYRDEKGFEVMYQLFRKGVLTHFCLRLKNGFWYEEEYSYVGELKRICYSDIKYSIVGLCVNRYKDVKVDNIYEYYL